MNIVNRTLKKRLHEFRYLGAKKDRIPPIGRGDHKFHQWIAEKDREFRQLISVQYHEFRQSVNHKCGVGVWKGVS